MLTMHLHGWDGDRQVGSHDPVQHAVSGATKPLILQHISLRVEPISAQSSSVRGGFRSCRGQPTGTDLAAAKMPSTPYTATATTMTVIVTALDSTCTPCGPAGISASSGITCASGHVSGHASTSVHTSTSTSVQTGICTGLPGARGRSQSQGPPQLPGGHHGPALMHRPHVSPGRKA